MGHVLTVDDNECSLQNDLVERDSEPAFYLGQLNVSLQPDGCVALSIRLVYDEALPSL